MKKAASIFLRADMEPRDVKNLSGWLENQRVTRYLNESERMPEQLRLLLENTPAPLLTCRFNQQGRFFLVCDETEDSIGFVKLRRQEDEGCYELVFAIGDETLWGNGYGSQAVQAAQRRAFFDWRARKMIAKIYHGNLRSQRTVLGCGFREERRMEALSCYSITLEEYLSHLTEGTYA